MTRDLTVDSQAAAEAPRVRPVCFAKLEFGGGDVFVNSSDRDIAFSGDTYLGVGNLGTVSGIEEGGTLQANGIQMTLSGIPSAYLSLFLTEKYKGRPVTLYHGYLDDDYALIADPIVQWVGRINQMSVALGEQAAITLTAENKLIRWENTKIRRYTDADQQGRFPGDLGLQFISQVVEKEILWGRTRQQ
jgi:hypothetical protein